MRTLFLCPAGISLLALSVCAPAVAADASRIEQVVVTATQSEQAAVLTPSSVVVVDRARIDAMGASNVADVLRAQAGIQLTDYGDSSRSTVSMRGFGANASNNTLILIDGRKLNNPSLEAPALSDISVSDIERIEIVEGSAGVLYGDQAVGGVINIITRRPEGKAYHHVETSVGSHDLKTYGGTSSQRFENGFAYRVSASSRNADNYRDNNEANYENIFARLEQHFEAASVFFEQQRIDDDMNLPGSLGEAELRDDRRQTTKPLDYSDRVVDMYRLGGELALGEQWRLLAEMTDRDTDGVGALWATPFRQGTHLRSYNPRLVGELPTANGISHLTLGYERQDSDYQRGPGMRRDYAQDMEALYGQVIYPVAPDWSLTLGAREAEVRDRNLRQDERQKEAETVTDAGISWQATENGRVFLRRSGILRFANADENGYTLPGIDFLDPQTGVSNELGAEWNSGAAKARVVLFDMELDGELYFDAATNGGWGANINLPSSERRGATVGGEYPLAEALVVGAHYTYTDAELSSGSFDGNEVPSVSENAGTVFANWSFLPGWSLYADAIYRGSRYSNDDDSNSYGKVDHYWLYNANVGWEQNGFSANLRLNNIAGEEYTTYASRPYDAYYAAPEETVELRVGYTF